MDSIQRRARTVELTGEANLRRAVTLLALALLVYLPFEAGLIGGLPPTIYWVLRLLPDALIALAAVGVVLFGDPRARTLPVRLLWAIGIVTAVLVVANAARGIPIVDSVNAIRVLVRYLVLGVLLWWAAEGDTGLPNLVIRAVLIATVLEILVALAQIAVRAASSATSSGNDVGMMFLDGSFGRYDRFGLFFMGSIIALVAISDRIRGWRLALIAVCAALLFLSTSRQAMVGLAVACAVIAVMPAITARHRALAGVVGALAIALMLISPSGKTAPAPVSQPGAGSTEQSDPGGDAPGPATATRPIKDTLTLSVDPNKNFRTFYNLELAPWAAATEPLMGFGPRQQVAEHPDPRLAARVAASGMTWNRARLFTNDSNYASLVIQFGAIVPALFLLLLAAVIFRAARAGLPRGEPGARFAVAFAAATLVAAFFGPAFEIRTVSIVLWVSLFSVLAATRVGSRGRNAGASPSTGPLAAD